ncbi:MAG: molybdate ABC transporter substrate-binding protein [Desulfobulbaceae bacterium]|nr:molybdate ABC transporter substrate-binding protein [Desulfobulbaceae bacterium]
MKTRKTMHFVLMFFCLFASLPAIAQSADVSLSVAASMTDAVRELAAAYTRENTGVSIRPNFGSSGSLAKQIAQGAPADIYISANTKWMDYLLQEGKIAGSTVRLFASNSLVFVGSPNPGVSSFAALPKLSRIAIGSPKSVPAGQYAEQAMRAAGIYEDMRAENKLVMAKDVRQALLYADRGEVDGAFVYKTDAVLVRQAVVLFGVPGNLHERIDYPVGLTREGEQNEAARSFSAFLSSPPALTILEKYGFSTPDASGVGAE